MVVFFPKHFWGFPFEFFALQGTEMFAHVFVKGATRNPLDYPNPGDSIPDQTLSPQN